MTGTGVLVLTPDTLLLRLADLDVWTGSFWRGLAMGLALLLGIAVTYRRATINVFLAMGWPGSAWHSYSVPMAFSSSSPLPTRVSRTRL